jgi:hypothetical protein
MTDASNPGPPDVPAPANQPAVPEHVWYDAAIDALGREESHGARLAALRMLKQAPRSWDAVMVVALTAREETLQVAALEALAAQVLADPGRRPAYERLGRLQIWGETARAAWLSGHQAVAGEPDTSAPPQGPTAQVEAPAAMRQVELLQTERERFAQEAEASRAEAERLKSELAALRVTCLEVEARLAAQTEAAGRLERAVEEARNAGVLEREALRRALAEREAELEGLAEAAWWTDRSRRRWVAVAAGGSLLAAGIIAAVVAARAPAMALEPSPKVLAASEAEGYRKALVALAAEASKFEADGDRVAATYAWRNIAALSTDGGLTAHATQRLEELRLAGGAAGGVQAAEGPSDASAHAEAFQAAPVVHGVSRDRGQAAVTQAAKRPRVLPSRPRREPGRAPARAGGSLTPPRPPVEPELVPADVRAKILELP